MELNGKRNKIIMKKISQLLSFIILFVSTNSCEDKKTTAEGGTNTGSDEKIIIDTSNTPNKKDDIIIEYKKIFIPKFNEDSAYYYVQKQVDFGPRVISSPAWLNCSKWLEKKLLSYTKNVQIQESIIKTYDNKQHTFKNIIASFNPQKENNRIALFAHWDSRHIADHDTKNTDQPILGANDGGSGVAVLIELARQFSEHPPEIGVDIILFDAEDYGQPENSKYDNMPNSWCLGSQYWSKNTHTRNYTPRYGILLDMVAGKNATFYKEGYSRQFAYSITDKIWTQAKELGYGKYFIDKNGPEIIDDHYYVNSIAEIPTVNIIEHDPSTKNGFNKHWHTHKDDMNNIDKKTLHAVGQTLLNIIYNE